MLLALTLAAPTTAGATSLDYAALGDSHAAGTGAGDYIMDSGECLRSPNSYASLVAADRGADLVFRACSGATTADIAAQAAVLDAGTDLVTVQVGGNDAGFAPTLVACKLGDDAQCDQAVTSAIGFMQTQLGGKLDAAYREIKDRAPNARVVVVGYPRLFETGGCTGEMNEHKRSWLNTAADYLNENTRNRAVTAGFAFVDVRSGFTGHGVCGADVWVNGLRSPLVESYHPNRDGQLRGYYRELKLAL